MNVVNMKPTATIDQSRLVRRINHPSIHTTTTTSGVPYFNKAVMNQPFWQQLKKEPPTRQTWQPTNDNNYNTSITCFNKSKSHVKAK